MDNTVRTAPDVSTKDKERNAGYIPRQIHIAFGENNQEIVIAWSTRLDPHKSVVKYGFYCNQTYKTAIGERKLLDSEGVILWATASTGQNRMNLYRFQTIISGHPVLHSWVIWV
ncbi:unnamed protein product [Medioppia subpectinata]|uniref:Uncharacterized protein n=1 Tax=Medioppia subpectinata TaxID=1979941 RepID=A0A7R9L7Y6_9ACAR|nr:unnamed protein product [Medioppia subpectinata]CAG2116108.1 unnamed protein product [Medioppia subpectinata]